MERLHLLTLRLKYHNATSRVMHLASKAGFHPDQPRVPRGDPDGGQWTLVGGGRAAGATLIDLAAEEARGGHAIARHVGKSTYQLIQRLLEPQATTGFFTQYIRIAGSFSNLESANKLVNSTLSTYPEQISKFLADDSLNQIGLWKFFSSRTGIEAYIPGKIYAGMNGKPPVSEARIRDTWGVIVWLRKDPASPRGWRIQTAFPITKEGLEQ